MRYRNTGKSVKYCSATRQSVPPGSSSSNIDSLAAVLRTLCNTASELRPVLSEEERKLIAKLLESDALARSKDVSRELKAVLGQLRGAAPKVSPLPPPKTNSDKRADRDAAELRAMAAVEEAKVRKVREVEAYEQSIRDEANAQTASGAVMDSHNRVKAVEGKMSPHVVDGVPLDFREAMEHNMALQPAKAAADRPEPVVRTMQAPQPPKPQRPRTPQEIEQHLERQSRLARKDDFVVASKDPRIIPGMPVMPGFDITKEDLGGAPRMRSDYAIGKGAK